MDNLARMINFWYEVDDMLNPGFVKLNNEGKMETEQDGSPKLRIKPAVLAELRITIFSIERATDTIFFRNYDRSSRKLNFDIFKEQIENANYKAEIKSLSARQLEIIHKHFPQYDEVFRDAFEQFGQGALFSIDHDLQRTAFDPQTVNLVKYRIHMADGSGIY